MSELFDRLLAAKEKMLNLQEHLDFDNKKIKLRELQRKTEAPDFWLNPDIAQGIMKQISSLKSIIEDWDSIEKYIADTIDLVNLGEGSFIDELNAQVEKIEKTLDKKELSVLLSGKYDHGNAILAIHAGAGGTDSQDWAAMLERMYLRWAERSNYHSEILDRTSGEEAGIKSVTLSISGDLAYGYLRPEKGVHRLVRLSPFDAAHRRHTSFALVEVLPEFVDEGEVVIPAEDIRIEVYKSSGAGGQNVQKNMTAVRIIHTPTGLVVTCQNERSQTQNRENALKVLKARLFEIKQEQQAETISELRGEYTKAEWGSQIRSYVLHPYQMVKDHRTDYETGNTQSVLDGDINDFIEAFLKKIKS
ncbi:MAG: peptide chain release factor 2 [Anaerolineaceae bacterium]|nr:peptide chain release factor 2 [Anaerolineaceae bacterium]